MSCIIQGYDHILGESEVIGLLLFQIGKSVGKQESRAQTKRKKNSCNSSVSSAGQI